MDRSSKDQPPQPVPLKHPPPAFPSEAPAAANTRAGFDDTATRCSAARWPRPVAPQRPPAPCFRERKFLPRAASYGTTAPATRVDPRVRESSAAKTPFLREGKPEPQRPRAT